MDTGRLVGVEALVRWPQQAGGMVMPNDFIPIAEQRGHHAIAPGCCATPAARTGLWQLSGLPRVPVAVNLSAIQFKQKNLVDEVERILAETGLDAASLEFELTESMPDGGVPVLMRTVDRCARWA